MFAFIRGYVAYLLSRKVKTIQNFVQTVNEEGSRAVDIGAMLDAGGLVDITSLCRASLYTRWFC